MNRLMRTWSFPKRKNAKPAETLPERYSARLSYTALESRIAFDGAAVAEAAAVTAAEPAGTQNSAAPESNEHQVTDAKAAPHGSAEVAEPSDAHDIAMESSAEQDADDLWEAAAMGPQPTDDRTTIVFVDQNVENFDQIVSGIDPSFEIVLIDGNSSGLEQISANLEGRTDIASIHIVSHGEAGRLFLGTDVLDLGTIASSHAETLAAIGSALSADGDILLYGCDVADGVTGLEFMEALSDVTGADIAASVDDTGDPTRGGNWTLERSVGSIETSSIYIDSYNGILSQNNTGTWSVAGTTATNTTAGVTTTVSFGSYSNGTTTVRNVVNDNLSNLAIFNPGGVQNTASLGFEFAWDTSPEAGTTEAAVDAGTGIVTITFSQAVTNPIIHLDRIGGSDGTVQNSASLTLLTSGVTLSRLSGTSHFAVNSAAGTISNSQVDVAIGGGFSGETSTTANAGTAGGSVQVLGTVTTIQFRLSAAPNANEGAGADAMELKVTFDPAPTAANDTFTTVHDTPVTIDVRSNDSDVNNDALTVTQVNGTAITAGGSGVAVTGGVVTLNTSGDLVFTPSANYAGSPSFTYTVADANGGTSTATVSGTVTNHAPVIDLNSTPTPVTTTDTTSSTSTTNLVTNGTFPTNGASPAGWTEGGTSDGQVVSGRYVWVDGPGTLAQNLTVSAATSDTTVSTTSTATSRTVTTTTVTTVDAVSSITFDMAYQNADILGANDNRLTVSYNGVTYAVFETAEGGVSAAAGTWTYFNGASGPASVNGVGNEETGTTTAITIGLPAGITSSGQLLFSYGAGSTGIGSDDLAIDNVVVTSTRTTTTTVETSTTTTDTANNGWAATYQENGTPISIADTDSSIFDGDDSNIEAANITLSNPQTGDRLLVGGSSAASGTIGTISWTRTNSVVMFSGTATAAQYANAIESVQFENTTDTPANVARTINVTVNDGISNSSTAVTTIAIDSAPDPTNDAFSGNEDTAISGNVLTNDTDRGDTPITSVTVASGPANGTLMSFNTATGAFVYTPNANFNGIDTFTYSLTDADGDTRTATVTLTVTPVNDAPVNVVPGARTTAEDTALAITGVSLSDVDSASLTTTLSVPVGSGVLTIVSGSGATVSGAGTSTVTITGTPAQINAAMATIIYTPIADFNGATSLTVSTSDGVAAPTSSSVAITVTSVADISNDAVSTNEDTPVTFAPLGNDSFENAGRTITAINGTAITAGGASVAVTGGSVALNASGTLTYTPNANFNGTPSFTYTVTSGGVTETATVNVTVTAINDAPVNVVPGAQSTAEDTTLSISGVSVSDVDNANLTTTLTIPSGTGALSVVGGSGATISTTGGGTTVTISGTAAQVNAALATITYTPTADYNGAALLTVSTTDGTATTANTVAITVTSVADITNDAVTTNEDTARTFNVLTGTNGATADTFENSGAAVTSVTQPSNGSVSFAANGAITYTPAANFNGSDSFTYTVTSGGVTETATVTVSVTAVNDAPVNSVPVAQSTTEDTNVVFSSANGNAITVADVDSALTTTLSVANGTLTLGSVSGVTVSGNGSGNVIVSGTPAQISVALNGLTFAPTADWNGSTTLNVSTSDGVAAAVNSTVQINVAAVADIVADSATTAEDTARTFNVLTNDNFENAGRLVTSVTQPAHGSVSFLGNGQVTYTPAANYNGSDSFTYTVTSGGVTETTTVTLTVTPVNDAPVASGTSITTAEDTARSGSLPVATDVDGDMVTYAKASDPAHGTVVVNSNGTYTYTPAANYNGADSFTYTVSDGNGGSNTYTVAINVTPVNDAPVAAGTSITTAEDTARSGSLPVASDVDGDTVTYAKASDPAHGTVVVNSNGTYTYTPAANYNGADSFTYTVSDGNGGSNTYTVAINVTPVNDAPVASGTSITTAEDTARSGSLPVASDVDGDMVTYAKASDPAHGTVVVNSNGTYTYTPAANYNGADSFTYTVSDDNGGSNTYTVAINVTPVNDAPVAAGTSITTAEDTARSGSLPAASDVDGDTVTYAKASDPANGTVVVNSNGTYTYTPAANYNGADSFTYTVSDGNGGSNTYTVAINVTPVNDAPVAAGTSISTAEDTARSGSLPVATDVDGDTVTYAKASDPAHGTVIVNSNGTYTYTPAANYNGADSFTYTVSDGNGGSNTYTVAINVTPVNDAPVASGTSITTAEDTARSGSLPVASDVDGDMVTYAKASDPAHGTVVVNSNGTYTYTPAANYNGADSFTYTVSDGNGGSNTYTVAINVTPVNDAPVAAGTSITTAEDTARSGSLPVATDVDGDTVTYAKASDPAHGTVVVNSNGTYTYTPAANYNGADSFTYTVSDGNGGSNTYTVAINVTPVNDAPVLSVPPAQAGTEDISVVFSSANGNQITIADVDDGAIVETSISVPTGTLTLGTTTGVTILAGANGTSTLTISGSPAAVTFALNGLIYAPVADAHGSVTLTVSTTDGVAATQSATVAMTFAPVADIANDGTVANEDSARTISVLANDSFENPDHFISAVSAPANGTVVINGDGTVTYTPNANFNGADSFTYTVTSGGVAETATVAVVVNPMNDAPVQTVPLAQTTAEDTSLTFSSGNGNAITVADIDGDALTTTVSVTNGALTIGGTSGVAVSGNGTATITISGTAAAINAALDGLNYSATADYHGSSALTVATTDGSVTASDVIAISVTPIVDIVSDTVSTNEDAPISFNVLDNDNFENAGAIVSSVSQGAMGTVSIGSGGVLTYTPNANVHGSDSFSYTVTSGGVTETTTVTVNIVPINDAPVTSVPGNQSTNEDVDLVFSAARGNAITIADVDGDTITVTISSTNGMLTLGSTTGVSVSGNGTATISVVGSASAITTALNGLAYASNDDYNGSAIINVTTTDGSVTQSQTVAVTIVPVADIVANSVSTNEDTPVTINVLANDTFESPARTVTSVTQGSSGSVAFMSDGTVTYTPNLDFTGTDTFTYTVSSGGVTETTTVTVSVGAVNDAPTTTGISDSSNLDGDVVSIDISTFFADDDGDALTYSATGLPAGLAIDPVSGVISGTIDRHASQGAPYSVVVTASDGNPGGDVSTAFTWSVTNPGPTANDDSVSVAEDVVQTISVLANDADPDFDALTVTAATAGNGVVTINGDGTLTYTPAANFHGNDTIVYQISDGDGGSSTATVYVTVTPVNDAPVAAGTSITTAEDTARSGSLPVATDVDGDTVTYAKASDPAHGTVIVNSNGTYTYTPAANYNGADSFTYAVSDGNGGSNTYTVAINVTPVNDAPVAAGTSITTAEDTARSGSLPVASDVDGDTVTYAKASDPAQGTVVVNSNGTYTYTPAANYNGADSFTYTVSDGNGGSNTYTVAINVTPVNDAPVASGTSITTAEDTARSGSLPVATDVDGDTVTYAKASDPAHGTVVVNSNGTYTYTPAANYNGADSFTYTVSDGNGGSNTYTVAINVTPVNDAPVASGTSITTAEDTARSGSLPVATDVDGDTVTYAKASDPAHGTVVVNSNGTYTYTPAANYNGADSFTYTVSDGNGGSNTYTVAINVTPVNDAPVAAGTSITTAEDTARSGSLPAASDVDGDTVTYAKASDPAHGTVVVNSNGTYTYTPAANYNGADSFTYTVSDGNGGSNTYTVAINVTPVNDAPVAVDDSFTGSEDTILTGDVTPGTPTQDRDVDGDVLIVVDVDGDMSNGVTPIVGPMNGTLVLNGNGTFSFTPNANFHGSDSFTYRITDGNGTFATATVTLTIAPANDAPAAANGSLTTQEDQAFSGILPVATDVDGDSLTYAAGATAPQHGSVVINSDGTYTYVPAANYSGSDSFTYVVRDGAATVERTVTVIVTPLNDAPTFTPIAAPVSADSANVRFDVSAFVVNVDGDSLTYAATGLPPGLSINPTTGVVTGTLPNDASQGGPYVVTLTVNDGQGGVATSSFTWQVNNPAPIARNDAIAIERGVSVVVPVLANDVDPDGDQLSVISASAQTGTVEVLADGSIRYTPRSDFNGRDTVTYRVADGNGGFAQATVTITVGSDLYVEQDQIFGFNGPETVANTDVLQSSPYDTISADGAVLEAVFNIGSLNSLAEQLSSDGAVISAANSVSSLGGIGSLGTSGIVIDTIRIERAREIAFNAGFERSHLDPRLEGLPGFSLRHNVPGNLDGLSAREQVVIESLVRDQTLIVQISNTIEDGVRRITEYRITQVDGSALPDWLDQIGPDLLMGRHEAGNDDIELRIEAIYSDGTSVVENVRIDAGTGEISPLAAPVKDAVAPQMFGDQFRAQHMLTPEQIQGLGQAIAP